MSEHVLNELVILGVGNDSRGDDGLGWAFLDALEEDPEIPARLIHRYQLQPEDAAEIAGAKWAVFVDASKEKLEKGFQWEEGIPDPQPMVHSHWLPPSAVLGFCRETQESCPSAFVLAISGYSWGLGEAISPLARQHLADALQFFKNWYRSQR